MKSSGTPAPPLPPESSVDTEETGLRGLRTWRDCWAAAHPNLHLDVLSMGMSGDFQLAIDEGSTRIRIGTALFGRRTPLPVPTSERV